MLKFHSILAGIIFSAFNFSLYSGDTEDVSSGDSEFLSSLHKEGVNYFLDANDRQLKKIEEKTNEKGESTLMAVPISLEEIPYWKREKESQYWFIQKQEAKGKAKLHVKNCSIISRIPIYLLRKARGIVWLYVKIFGTINTPQGQIAKKEITLVLWFPNWPGLENITDCCLIDKILQGVMFINYDPKDEDFKVNENKFIALPCFVNYCNKILSFCGILQKPIIVSFSLKNSIIQVSVAKNKGNADQMFVWKNSEMPKVTTFNVNCIKQDKKKYKKRSFIKKIYAEEESDDIDEESEIYQAPQSPVKEVIEEKESGSKAKEEIEDIEENDSEEFSIYQIVKNVCESKGKKNLDRKYARKREVEECGIYQVSQSPMNIGIIVEEESDSEDIEEIDEEEWGFWQLIQSLRESKGKKNLDKKYARKRDDKKVISCRFRQRSYSTPPYFIRK